MTLRKSELTMIIFFPSECSSLRNIITLLKKEYNLFSVGYFKFVLTFDECLARLLSRPDKYFIA